MSSSSGIARTAHPEPHLRQEGPVWVDPHTDTAVAAIGELCEQRTAWDALDRHGQGRVIHPRYSPSDSWVPGLGCSFCFGAAGTHSRSC